MKSLPLFALALSFVAAGCSRGVCEPEHESAKVAPMTEPWTSHKELIPGSATVCGNIVARGETLSESLSIDFADDPNPWVTIVDHLEKQGFERTSQSIDDPDAQLATLRKGGTSVSVRTSRSKGRTGAVMVLELGAKP